MADSSSKTMSSLLDHPRLIKANENPTRIFSASTTNMQQRSWVVPIILFLRKLSNRKLSDRSVFFLDPEYLESMLGLEYIEGVNEFQDLSGASLRNVLDFHAKEAMETGRMKDVDRTMESNLIMNMSDESAMCKIFL